MPWMQLIHALCTASFQPSKQDRCLCYRSQSYRVWENQQAQHHFQSSSHCENSVAGGGWGWFYKSLCILSHRLKSIREHNLQHVKVSRKQHQHHHSKSWLVFREGTLWDFAYYILFLSFRPQNLIAVQPAPLSMPVTDKEGRLLPSALHREANGTRFEAMAAASGWSPGKSLLNLYYKLMFVLFTRGKCFILFCESYRDATRKSNTRSLHFSDFFLILLWGWLDYSELLHLCNASKTYIFCKAWVDATLSWSQ